MTSSSSARKRSLSKSGAAASTDDDTAADKKTLVLLRALLQDHEKRTGQSVLHTATTLHSTEHLGWATALLERCCALDKKKSLLRQVLLARDTESGYTPLHWAIYQGNLSMLLLLLRAGCCCCRSDQQQEEEQQQPLRTSSLTQRPMALLQGDSSSSSNNNNNTRMSPAAPNNKKRPSRGSFHQANHNNLPLLSEMMQATDHEGNTPAQLLALQQRSELRQCRAQLPRILLEKESQPNHQRQQRLRRGRGNSFHLPLPDDDEQNEFHVLSRSYTGMRQRQQQQQQRNPLQEEEEEVVVPAHGTTTTTTTTTTRRRHYGCEVLTYGRAHHCALGVAVNQQHAVLRPQRVLAFGLLLQNNVDSLDSGGGAVAVAAATHHTLVVTATGQLYAFGLGKGGRLGTGNELPCSLPVPVRWSPQQRQVVVAVAAAENHSLCATQCGEVYCWGSNRFGQLGTTTSSTSTADNNNNSCVPRRVENLRTVPCVAVAAGEKHSVALSQRGEVYVWGENAAGQLGTNRRSGTHKVQRVEALWNNARPGIAIAASAKTTMVLTVPGSTGLPVHAIYSWGHGSHVPSRVVLEPNVDPVAIACARYHYAAVTADGRVYTWGLHQDALGTNSHHHHHHHNKSPVGKPQLVTGLLSQKAVAVAASEHHTAVVTDTGALFTWGATTGKNILGHEGVRWQPDPKRVPGVQRAVGVSVAKEHTILLVGTSFPPIPSMPYGTSLELLAARQVATHVDLFNVVLVAVMANRFENAFLKEYCAEFIRRNLDGILNVCQKSVMNTFLTEQLAAATMRQDRDGVYHPLLLEVLNPNEPKSIRLDEMIETDEWLQACEALAETEMAQRLMRQASQKRPVPPRTLVRGESASSRCLELTTDMNLETKELARSKEARLSKEIRAIRKRLSQIAKLGARAEATLSPEEEEKLSRKSQLEADLKAFEPAFDAVRRKVEELCLAESKTTPNEKPCEADGKNSSEKPPASTSSTSIRCDDCKVTCTDQKNFQMHVSGRKHRNRLAQVADEEKKQAALSMMADQQRQRLQGNLKPEPVANPPNIWNRRRSKAQPKFNLPPPPIPVPDSIACSSVSQRPAAPSLLDIMATEENTKATPANRQKKRADDPISLPPGSLPRMKSPPWASAPVVDTASPASASFSLGDFIPTPAEVKPSPLPGSWASPKAHGAKNASAVKFSEIQQAEQELKEKADNTFSPNGKWFIERRERAGSFREIEESAEKEREHRLLVEEQLRIEQQIQAELQRKVKASSKRKTRRRKAKQADEANEHTRSKGSTAT